MRRSGVQSGVDSDSTTVTRVGTVLSGEVPERFDVFSQFFELAVELPSTVNWLLGTPSGDGSSTLQVALYPDGAAAYVAECVFALYTMPMYQLSKETGLTTADLWLSHASGEFPELPSELRQLRDREVEVDNPVWTDLEPTERSIDSNAVPSDVLEGSVPFIVNLVLPEEWTEAPGFVCVLTDIAWAGCTDYAVASDGFPLDLRGLAPVDSMISLGFFQEGSTINSPVQIIELSPLNDFSVQGVDRISNYELAAGSTELTGDTIRVEQLPDSSRTLRNVPEAEIQDRQPQDD
jgi:hypothetical protein